ncbi:hypothetical protein LIX17_25495 (plasmid) [Mycobacterium avium subsp. hominissuis]|uniref:hypothetical protein n=1 Tax=Mycobacterium avium TaxID=1764 RepID=UPI003140C562
MSPRADDLTSPAGALSAALAALCEASTADEQWRRWQYARTAADYAAEAWWHPDSTAEQRAEASRCLKLSDDLDEESKARRDRERPGEWCK